MFDDIRYALRSMARQKAFTSAVLVTLALGIGANTAIVSMVYGVLLRPLPYPTSERLVRLAEAHPGGTPIVRVPMISNVTFHQWRREMRTIDGLAAYRNTAFTMLDRGEASRVAGALVSPALFELLAVRPIAGRLLQEPDARPAAPRVAVLGESFWHERFGGDPSVVGRTVSLDEEPHTIVGVAPAAFYFPTREARLWAPYVVPDTPAAARFSIFAALARLKPGVTPEQAAAEGTAAARAAGPRHVSATLLFGTGGPPAVDARLLIDDITATVRPALLVLLVSVALLLLIACANVANLLLSRGVARGRELAVRAAIGARSGRLVRQLMTEALVLAVAGGILGVALGWMLTRAIPAMAPPDFPRLDDIRLDAATMAFAAALSIVSGLIAGALPAVRVVKGRLPSLLREGASPGVQTRRLGAGLLIGEAAVAVMLLVAAGLLGRSFMRLLAVDPGYDAANVLMASVELPPRRDAAADREELFARTLLERIRALPGVVAAGASNMAPFVPVSGVAQVTLRGDSAAPITARALSYVVTPGYAEAMSLHLRQGRVFDERDLSSGIHAMLVNEEFARLHFHDGKPAAGRRFVSSFAGTPTVEIVGVVANVLKDGLDTQPQAEMYSLPRAPFGLPPSMNLAMRTSGDPLAMAAAVRAAVHDLEPAAVVEDVETLGSRIAASVSQPRFAMSVVMAFAIVAVALAAVGLYGVLSYQLLQRRREMGVRAALGASRRSLVGLVLRQGVAITSAGIALGLVAALWLSRLMEGLLFGVTPHDALVFAAAPAMLLAVAVVATLVPARRAASADPIHALRCE